MKYAYDPAGNILEKTVNGKRTSYTYDKANQLVTATAPDGKVTKYAYDAAGRMVREGTKSYRYGYLDKVLAVTEGKNRITYGYHVDGQLATVTKGNVTEEFTWDGLALVKRGTTSYVNEPHPGGGAPVASSDGGVMFNDILGTTLGVENAGGYVSSSMTAFGDAETADDSTFFTGKPHVEGFGHAFLLRNYRADLGKWPTADPLGYPDGWNQMAYGVNSPMEGFDYLGGAWDNLNFLSYYFNQDANREDPIDTDVMGLTGSILYNIMSQIFPSYYAYIDDRVKDIIVDSGSGFGSFSFAANRSYGVSCEDICFSLGGGSVMFTVLVEGYWESYFEDDIEYIYYKWEAHGKCKYSDAFRDALDVFNLIKNDTYIDLGSFYIGVVGNTGVGITVPANWEFPYGRPFSYGHTWDYENWGDGVIRRAE